MLTDREILETLMESHKNIHRRLQKFEMLVGLFGAISLIVLWRIADKVGVSWFNWL